MDVISYNYGAGDALSQAMTSQAAMLSQHAHDLLTAGKALTADSLVGLGGSAYLETLTRLTSLVSDLGDTIVRHSAAVGNSFHSANAVDGGAANMFHM